MQLRDVIDREEVLAIPHQVYLATRQGESYKLRENKLELILTNNRIFTPQGRWISEGRKYCSTYTRGVVIRPNNIGLVRSNRGKVIHSRIFEKLETSEIKTYCI